MTTSSIKRRRSPHDARASNDDGDGLDNDNEMDNNSTSVTNNSITITSNLGKRDSEEDSWASKGYSYINPFVHRIQIDNHIDVAKVSFLFPFHISVCKRVLHSFMQNS